jgi:hypothetical protein
MTPVRSELGEKNGTPSIPVLQFWGRQSTRRRSMGRDRREHDPTEGREAPQAPRAGGVQREGTAPTDPIGLD